MDRATPRYPSFMQAFDARLPPVSEDDRGVLRVGGTRVSLESVVIAFDRGVSAEEIVDSFPTLDLAAVYATPAFVLSNLPVVGDYLSRRQAAVEVLRAEAERRFPSTGLRPDWCRGTGKRSRDPVTGKSWVDVRGAGRQALRRLSSCGSPVRRIPR